MVKSGWLLFVALAPCIALASPAVEPKKDAAAVKQDEQDVVCTRQKSLGSNMSKKVCTTAAQRQAARDKAQKDVQQLGSCASNDPGTCIGEF
jgi:hypothetical protein